MSLIAARLTQRPAAQMAAKALAVLDQFLGSICGCLLAALLALVLGSVVLRYGFSTGIPAVDELAIWLHIALVGLGAPLALGGKLDIRFDVLAERLSGLSRAVLDTVAQTLTLLGCLTLAGGAGGVIVSLGATSTVLALPEWLRFAAPCIGGLMMLAVSTLRAVVDGCALRLAIASVFAVSLFLLPVSPVVELGPISPSVLAIGILLIGVAVGASLPLALLAALFLAGSLEASLTPPAIASVAVAGISKFLLLAIPFFLLAGSLFAISGLADRLIKLSSAFVGHWRGGVAQTALLTSVMFSGASGSSIANAAFGAKTFVPALVRQGHSPASAGAVVAATSVLDNVIPPSIAFLILASVTNLSVGKLLVGGLWAGLLMAAALAAMIRWTAPMSESCPTAPQRLPAFIGALPALGFGVIVLAGIRFGVVTPTEAAGLAALYTLIACVVGRVSWTGIVDAFQNAATATAGIGLLIAAAAPFAYLLAVDGMAGSLGEWVTIFGDNPLMILIIMNLVLLVAGMFLDTGAAIILFAPILLPLAVAVGIDPIHFGVILVVNLMIGGLTPPVGILVYVVAGVTRQSPAAVFAAVLPYVGALLSALAVMCLAAWLAIP